MTGRSRRAAGTALHKLAVDPFLKLWEHQVFKLLLDAGRISPETVARHEDEGRTSKFTLAAEFEPEDIPIDEVLANF